MHLYDTSSTVPRNSGPGIGSPVSSSKSATRSRTDSYGSVTVSATVGTLTSAVNSPGGMGTYR